MNGWWELVGLGPSARSLGSMEFQMLSREDQLKWRESWKRDLKVLKMRKEMSIELNWGDTCRIDESIAGNYLLTFTDF